MRVGVKNVWWAVVNTVMKLRAGEMVLVAPQIYFCRLNIHANIVESS